MPLKPTLALLSATAALSLLTGCPLPGQTYGPTGVVATGSGLAPSAASASAFSRSIASVLSDWRDTNDFDTWAAAAARAHAATSGAPSQVGSRGAGLRAPLAADVRAALMARGDQLAARAQARLLAHAALGTALTAAFDAALEATYSDTGNKSRVFSFTMPANGGTVSGDRTVDTDGLLVHSYYEWKPADGAASGAVFRRETTRQPDGSYAVLLHRERLSAAGPELAEWHMTILADGSIQGLGTLTRAGADGKVRTHEVKLGGTLTNTEASASDATAGLSAVVSLSADGEPAARETTAPAATGAGAGAAGSGGTATSGTPTTGSASGQAGSSGSAGSSNGSAGGSGSSGGTGSAGGTGSEAGAGGTGTETGGAGTSGGSCGTPGATLSVCVEAGASAGSSSQGGQTSTQASTGVTAAVTGALGR